MSIISSNVIAGASGQAGYNLNNSLRFRASNSAYLSRTLTTPTNNKIWTYSTWVKRSTLTSTQILLATASEELRYISDGGASGVVDSFQYNAGAGYGFRTNAIYRDVSAWYHIVVAVDTTQATAANRARIYINGVEASTDGTYNITQNTNTQINSAVAHNIGRRTSGSLYFDGYQAETYFVDGQQLTPSSFGETSTTTGSWIPKAYSGSYGTNGFKLNFSDTSAATAAAIGKDSSGNGNNWTPNNISVTAGSTYDPMLDVPTNTSATVANYAVLNPIFNPNGTIVTYSNANLNFSYSSTATANKAPVMSTIGVSSSKWYFEFTEGSPSNSIIGITSGIAFGGSANGVNYAVYGRDGGFYASAGTTPASAATWTNGDIIGVAFDIDARTIQFYKNNVSQGTITNIETSLTWFPYSSIITGASGGAGTYNFGQRPFSYTPPSGFVALNTFNLPTPTILQGNKYMDATLYTGNGTNAPNALSVTNAGAFKPDLVWIKTRSGTDIHNLQDSVRGLSVRLSSNNTNADSATGGGDVSSLNSNGFTISYNNAWTNANASTYVGWQWQAGQGSSSSNTSGSITSTVSVNTTAGFSVVTFSGNGVASTIGHGLGVAPSMIITKGLSLATGWAVYHKSLTNAQNVALFLNTTATPATSITYWNNTAPTSTVYSVGIQGVTNANFGGQVAYCWAEIAGFSKFGSYTGNGSADGPFVYCGFRPKFILLKCSSAVSVWLVLDSARSTYNVMAASLFPNTSGAEDSTYNQIDFLSNGFKMRADNANSWIGNVSGNTYIFAAFAENPFKNANAR